MRRYPLVTTATISPDGAPQAAILGVAANDHLELVFDTVDNSQKFRNVQRDGRVAVVFGAAGGYKSGSHDERTVQYEGRADIPSGEELKRVQEEIYFIVEGTGEMCLGEERMTVTSGQAVYIPHRVFHQLTNIGETPLRMIYCYGPAGDVAHWRQELDGTLPRAGVEAPPLPEGAHPQKT